MTPPPDSGTVRLRPATDSDLTAIEAMLVASGLPTAGVRESLHGFTVAELGGASMGVIGLEVYGARFGLLRSAAVDPACRGRGLGSTLVEHVLAEAADHGIESVYLLTTTAQDWFPSFGFERTSRDAVPESVRQSVEFTEACPASAIVMALHLPRSRSAEPT